MKFNPEEIKKFLQLIKKNHRISTLDKWQGENCIILRHDVEISLISALKLAKLEKKIGTSSSFFITLSCNSYNPLTKRNQRIIKEISQMGMEVGLHFDPTAYKETSKKEIEKKFLSEIEILENIITKKIRSYSQHRPTLYKDKFLNFSGYKSAYDKSIFNPNCYISDSRMVFKKDLYEFVKKSENAPIQVLIHPFHFMAEGENYQEKLKNELVKDYVEQTDKEFRTISTYKKSMKKKSLIEIIRENRGKK